MKIDRPSISPIGNVQPVNKTAKADKKNGNNVNDQVSVSGNAQLFQRLLDKAKELPEIREDKVNAVREQLAKGEFNLDSASIADSLLLSEKTEDK